MALQGAEVRTKIVMDPGGTAEATLEIGLVQSLTPSSSTTATTETGLGGIVKKRLTAQEFNFGWEGLITNKNTLNAGLPLDSGVPYTLDLYMHDEKLSGAQVATMSLSGSEGEALNYSLEGQFLTHATVTPADADDPDTYFVYSDGSFYFGNTTSITSETPTGSGTNYETAQDFIEPGTLVITADAATITDGGDGTLSDGGTINYLTGAFVLNASATTVSVDYDYYGSQETIQSFNVDVSRTINFVYGTSLSPTSLEVGTTTYSGSIEVQASSFSAAMDGAVASGTPDFGFMLSFVNPISAETMLIIGTGAQFTAADGSVDPDSALTVTKTFEFEAMTVS